MAFLKQRWAMKIVVGLGNPDKKYQNNFHNLGFMAVDRLATDLGVEFSKKLKLKSLIAQGVLNGEKFVLVKPQTYMNLSGEAVLAVMNFFGASLKDLIVAYDDLDIEIGSMRIRAKGSAGSHNGMKNIVQNLSSTEFKRIRIGIKKENENIPTIDYVLANIPKEKAEEFDRVLTSAKDALKDFVFGKDVEFLMAKYN